MSAILLKSIDIKVLKHFYSTLITCVKTAIHKFI